MDIKLTPTTLAKLSKAIGGHPLSFIAAQTDGANRWYYTHEFRSPSEAILVMNAFRRTLDRSVYNALETTALFLVLGEGEGRVVIQTPFFVKKTSQKNASRNARLYPEGRVKAVQQAFFYGAVLSLMQQSQAARGEAYRETGTSSVEQFFAVISTPPTGVSFSDFYGKEPIVGPTFVERGRTILDGFFSAMEGHLGTSAAEWDRSQLKTERARQRAMTWKKGPNEVVVRARLLSDGETLIFSVAPNTYTAYVFDVKMMEGSGDVTAKDAIQRMAKRVADALTEIIKKVDAEAAAPTPKPGAAPSRSPIGQLERFKADLSDQLIAHPAIRDQIRSADIRQSTTEEDGPTFTVPLGDGLDFRAEYRERVEPVGFGNRRVSSLIRWNIFNYRDDVNVAGDTSALDVAHVVAARAIADALDRPAATETVAELQDKASRTPGWSLISSPEQAKEELQAMAEVRLTRRPESILFIGPRGTGILPIVRRMNDYRSRKMPLSSDELALLKRGYSEAKLDDAPIFRSQLRPFRAPHSSISRKGLETEERLAQYGVLFLDDVGMFPIDALEYVAMNAQSWPYMLVGGMTPNGWLSLSQKRRDRIADLFDQVVVFTEGATAGLVHDDALFPKVEPARETVEPVRESSPAAEQVEASAVNKMLHEFIKQIEPTNQTLAQAAATLVPDAAKIARGERVRATYLGMQIKGDRLVVTAYAVPDVREYIVLLRIIERAPRVAGDTLADMMKMDKLQFSTPREPVILEPKTSGIMQRITIRDVGNLEGIASATPGSSMSFAFMADGMMPGPLTSLITAMGRRSGKPVYQPPEAIGGSAMKRRMGDLATTGGVVILPNVGNYQEVALRAVAAVVKANANVHAIASGSRTNIEGMRASKRDVFESMFDVLYTVSLSERDIVQIARRLNDKTDAAEAEAGSSAMPTSDAPIPVSGESIGARQTRDREADREVIAKVTGTVGAVKVGAKTLDEAHEEVIEEAEMIDPDGVEEAREDLAEGIADAIDEGAIKVDGSGDVTPTPPADDVEEFTGGDLEREIRDALLGGDIEDEMERLREALGIK